MTTTPMRAGHRTRAAVVGSSAAGAPTTVAQVRERRRALRAVQAIDELLRDDLLTTHGAPWPKARDRANGGGDGDGGPGPGAYEAHRMALTRRRESAAVTLRPPAAPRSLSGAVARKTVQRRATLVPPGPGAYASEDAERLTRPRVRVARIRPPPPADGGSRTLKEDAAVAAPAAAVVPIEAPKDLMRAADDRVLSTRRPVHGVVGYGTTTGDPIRGLPLERRKRLRWLRIERTRYKRIGFYTVNHGPVERRLGAIGIVPMGPSSSHRPGPREREAITRQKFRAWKPGAAAARVTEQTALNPDRPSPRRVGPHLYKRTPQWQRARVHRQAPVAVVPDPPQPKTQALPVLKFAKQHGRDVVQCRKKNHRVVIRFGATPSPRGRSTCGKSAKSASPAHQSPLHRCGLVSFDKQLGRADNQVDEHGCYILGSEWDRMDEKMPVEPEIARIKTQRRTPMIDFARDTRPRFETQAPSRLEPLDVTYNLVAVRTVGHDFVRFDNQLDRDDCNGQRCFGVDGGIGVDTSDSKAAADIAEKLRYR